MLYQKLSTNKQEIKVSQYSSSEVSNLYVLVAQQGEMGEVGPLSHYWAVACLAPSRVSGWVHSSTSTSSGSACVCSSNSTSGGLLSCLCAHYSSCANVPVCHSHGLVPNRPGTGSSLWPGAPYSRLFLWEFRLPYLPGRIPSAPYMES